MLEHHADLAADLVDLLQVVGELDPVDDDPALLMLLEPIDAADHGRLAGAGRAADDDALAARDVQVDVPQNVELAVPFVDVDQLDGGRAGFNVKIGMWKAARRDCTFGHGDLS